MPKIYEPSLFKDLSDIRVNPDHWIQKINVINFIDENGRTWWTRDYNKIPHYQRFNEATKWYKNTEFEEFNCKVVKNENNEIEIITKNAFGPSADIYWRQMDIIRKIRKKLAEKMRKPMIFFDESEVKIDDTPEEIPTNATQEEKEAIKQRNKELKALGKSGKVEEYLKSEYKNIYPEECEELRKLQIKKGKLGKDQVQKSYDLNRQDLAILWRKQLYFIYDFRYINNYYLWVVITAKKCPLALYYWNWQSKIAGRGMITHAPSNFIKEPSKDLMESKRMHYEFCGELGVKRIFQSAFHSYQPEFVLFQVMTDQLNRIPRWSEQKKAGDRAEGKSMEIPSSVYIKQLLNKDEVNNKVFGGNTDGTSVFKDLLSLGFLGLGHLTAKIGKLLAKIATLGLAGGGDTDAEKQMREKMSEILIRLLGLKVFFTVGSKEHNDDKAFYSNLEVKKEILFDTEKGSEKQRTAAKGYKKWFKEQPHLWDHTTFQFYLFNNITMMANAQFLGIMYNHDEDRFYLPYKLFINHAPGVLVYRWEFLYINVKCEVKVMGAFENNALSSPSTMAKMITDIKVFGCGVGINTRGLDLDPKNMRNELGADENAQQELQGERTFKSTLFDSLNKTIEPSMFHANTVDFHYSLGEFFCRLTDPIWFYRIELSELLYNNLNWCNGKSKILHLPLQWETLTGWTQGRKDGDKDTRKLGYWKWSGVHLEDDYDGFFAGIMNKGYWLDGGKKLENPKLDYIQQKGYVEIGGNSWDQYEGEEEIREIETWEEVENEGGTQEGNDDVSIGPCGIMGLPQCQFY